MSITFLVDRVEQARKRAPERRVSKAFAEITDREVIAWSVPEGRVLKGGGAIPSPPSCTLHSRSTARSRSRPTPSGTSQPSALYRRSIGAAVAGRFRSTPGGRISGRARSQAPRLALRSVGTKGKRVHIRPEPRFNERVRCRVRVAGSSYRGMVQNLSWTGLFVETAARPDPGSQVWLELSPDSPGLLPASIRLAARVVWKRVADAPSPQEVAGGVGLKIQGATESYYNFLLGVAAKPPDT